MNEPEMPECPRPPRGMWRLIFDPVVGPFFLAQILTNSAVWIHNIAAAIIVFDLTGSATLVAATTIAQFAPQLLLTPWTGALADRGDRRLQTMTGRALSGVGSGGLALWAVTLGFDGYDDAWAVVISSLIVGLGFSIGGPAMQAMIPSLVPPAEIAGAIALTSIPFTIARSAGPVLGAVLLTAGGPILAFGVACAGHAVFVIVLALLKVRDSARKRPSDSSMRTGFRHIRADPASKALLLGIVTLGVGVDPPITLSPSIADELDGGPALVGALASAFGIGAAGSFILLQPAKRWMGQARTSTFGLLVLIGGMLGLAVAQTPAAALAGMCVSGVGMTLAMTTMTTLLQQRSPEHLRGRIMGLWLIAFLGPRPFAAAVNGAVADATSAHVAVLIVAAVVCVGAWWARPSKTAPGTSTGAA